MSLRRPKEVPGIEMHETTRPSFRGRTPQLLLGHDRRQPSQTALAFAIELALCLKAHLHVAHIVTLGDYPVDPDRADWEDESHRVLTAERGVIHATLALSQLRWTYHESHGEPVTVLMELAEQHEVDIIVVGTSSRGVIQRLLSPSVSRGLLQHQRRPVLVVPGE